MTLPGELYETILDKAGVGILVYQLQDPSDANSLRLVYANQAAADFVESDVLERVGGTILEAFPNLAETGLVDAFRDAVVSQTPVELQDVVYGDERIPNAVFACEAAPIGDDHLVVSFRNVTDLRRAQRELNAKVVEMEKMATLGNLLAGIAHEIRTPLGALSSNNDVTRVLVDKAKGKLDDADRLVKMLERIASTADVNRTALERMTDLVDSLRRMGRKQASEQGAVDVHAVIESTLTLLRHELKYGVVVDKAFGEAATVVGHAGQLAQVFNNLILNASQAMNGKGTIRIETKTDGDELLVSVSDDGCGIEQDDIGRVFEAGFTTKDASAGTGLGLAICAEIVRAHGGSIDVSSAAGEGTTFVLRFPLQA